MHRRALDAQFPWLQCPCRPESNICRTHRPPRAHACDEVATCNIATGGASKPHNRIIEDSMRGAVFVRVAFALVALAACRADAPLAPSEPGHADRNPNIPEGLFASYTPVELPGAGTGIVADINDGGDAVGVADGAGAIWRGVAHTKGDLPFIPAAIANDGTIAGNLDGHAVMFRNGQLIPLDTASSTATAICRCASETIVGSVEVNGEQHAAIWVGGVRIDAGVPLGGTSSEFTAAASGRFFGIAFVPTVKPCRAMPTSHRKPSRGHTRLDGINSWISHLL